MSEELQAMLIRHEGMRLKPYLDTQKRFTLGVGRNIEDVGISEKEALMMLDNDIRAAERACRAAFIWFDALDWVRQDVVVSMAFNLGISRLFDFKRFLAAMASKSWDVASNEMLASAWAGQVGKRAVELSGMIRSGTYQYNSVI